MTTHLVISGGGVKGAAIIGALEALHEKEYYNTLHTFIGSSVGAILCTLTAVGYKPTELYNILLDLDLQKYIDYNFIEFFHNIGVSKGEDLIKLLGSLLSKKGVDRNITFIQLKTLLGKTVIMTGSNLSKECTDYFGPETTPDMKILEAIRITISYPLFFTPPIYNGDTYVDGALFDPFPINLFPNAQKIGILIDAERVFNTEYKPNHKIEGFEHYLYILVKTMMGRYVKLSCKNMFDNTIGIDLSQYTSMNFDITQQTKEAMYKAGYDAAKQYLILKQDQKHDPDKH